MKFGKNLFAFFLIFTAVFAFPSLAHADEAEGESEFGTGPAIINSLIIILREGIEAILIVAAIAAYLVASGNKPLVRHVYLGVGLALVASLVTAFLFQWVFTVTDAQKELLEGLTMLLAASVLLFVTNWMLAKAEAVKWQKYIKGKVEKAVSSENVWAIVAVSFLAVYREGFETVLFYNALLFQTNSPLEVFAGLIIGLVLLVGIFIGIMRLGLRLPLNVFFLSTSLLLFILAFSFAGSGVHELQEAGLVPETDVSFIEIEELGIRPTIETLGLQALVLLFGAGMAYIHLIKHHDLKEKN